MAYRITRNGVTTTFDFTPRAVGFDLRLTQYPILLPPMPGVTRITARFVGRAGVETVTDSVGDVAAALAAAGYCFTHPVSRSLK